MFSVYICGRFTDIITLSKVPHTFTINDKEVTAIVPHEILQTIAVRYVSHDKCIKTDNATIAPHLIKIDNFCSELSKFCNFI